MREGVREGIEGVEGFLQIDGQEILGDGCVLGIIFLGVENIVTHLKHQAEIKAEIADKADLLLGGVDRHGSGDAAGTEEEGGFLGDEGEVVRS